MAEHKVKARVRMQDNGAWHEPGEAFEMEASLVGPHVAAGQVEDLGPADEADPAGVGA